MSLARYSLGSAVDSGPTIEPRRRTVFGKGVTEEITVDAKTAEISHVDEAASEARLEHDIHEHDDVPDTKHASLVERIKRFLHLGA